MRVFETTAHVGVDGMLRLVVPADQWDRDVEVTVVLETETATVAPAADRWSDVRARLQGAGIHVPLQGVQNPGRVVPQDLPGLPASELLVSDRR